MENKEFKIGGMWEESEWSIIFDCDVSSSGITKCKHCSEDRVLIHKRYDDSVWEEKVFTCPSVVTANNEGGHNSTGICLQCILEAGKEIKCLSNNQ